ncbi:MAG: DUF4443 domain-containing protein [Nitrosopumilus sp.]
MHNVVKQLAKIADRYAPSRMLSYDLAHVFRALQLIDENGRVSRNVLMGELNLGEGSIKTLVKHLKMQNFVETSNAGMWFTNKGKTIYEKLKFSMPEEISLGKCSLGLGEHNHVILLKELGDEIGTGIEQRDAAIKIGGMGATTLIYQEKKFLMPDRNQDSMRKDPNLKKQLLEKLAPQENDVIIIASSNNKKNANLAAKSAALQTIADHEKH